MMLRVAAPLLMQILEQGNEFHVRCVSGMTSPEDYRIVDVRMIDADTIELALQHKLDDAPNPAPFVPEFERLECAP